MKRVTLDDVARMAGVSPITVSRALRNPQSVSGRLRERIEKAVAELGYVSNLAASRLASSRSQAIGVIVPTLYNIIFADYLSALHEVLVDAGFQVVVSTAATRKLRRRMRSRLCSVSVWKRSFSPASITQLWRDSC